MSAKDRLPSKSHRRQGEPGTALIGLFLHHDVQLLGGLVHALQRCQLAGIGQPQQLGSVAACELLTDHVFGAGVLVHQVDGQQARAQALRLQRSGFFGGFNGFGDVFGSQPGFATGHPGFGQRGLLQAPGRGDFINDLCSHFAVGQPGQ